MDEINSSVSNIGGFDAPTDIYVTNSIGARAFSNFNICIAVVKEKGFSKGLRKSHEKTNKKPKNQANMWSSTNRPQITAAETSVAAPEKILINRNCCAINFCLRQYIFLYFGKY
jgi:hypothetical protein